MILVLMFVLNLKNKAAQLPPNQQLDEIHNKVKFVYGNGKECEYAENKRLKEGNQMQWFHYNIIII